MVLIQDTHPFFIINIDRDPEHIVSLYMVMEIHQ